VDFADVRTIMKNSGAAIMGIGIGEGDNKAEIAAKAAIKSPLISMPLQGAQGVLFNIESAPDVGLFEITKAADIITATAHEDAQIIWGHTLNEDLGKVIRITVIATGFSENAKRSPSPLPEKKEFPTLPRLKRPGIAPFAIDETDLQPVGEEDMFTGMPKTTYDTPAILRRKQK
jgi:cell division protein FtsZ